MLNWTYVSDPDEGKVKAFADAGLNQIVCPGTSSWNRFVEEIDRSEGNITPALRITARSTARSASSIQIGRFRQHLPVQLLALRNGDRRAEEGGDAPRPHGGIRGGGKLAALTIPTT